MIGSYKTSRENYPRKCFWTQEEETRVKFNPRLSANRLSKNWALCDRAYGFSPLSQKTRMSNHWQMQSKGCASLLVPLGHFKLLNANSAGMWTRANRSELWYSTNRTKRLQSAVLNGFDRYTTVWQYLYKDDVIWEVVLTALYPAVTLQKKNFPMA